MSELNTDSPTGQPEQPPAGQAVQSPAVQPLAEDPAEHPAERSTGFPAASPGQLPPKGTLRRRRTAGVLGAALLALTVVAGVGFTAVTVSGADRDPGKPVWTFPGAQAKSKGNQQAPGLRGMLLPFDRSATGYTRGPDIGGFGSDAELDGAEATALRKQSIRGLPPQTRRKLEEMIDKQHIVGMAMRSYQRADTWSVSQKHAFTISFQLLQMENRTSVRDLAAGQRETFTALQVFRKGPAIPGHKNAACFLTPKGDGEKLARMFCSAYAGNVLVGVNVSGNRSLDTNALALFVARQLDRIKDPGESV
ncbi:hypothetical protein ACFZCP_03970 [Streptomyces sp. NPDC007971]|uniref:hypothetical protein n=1 Tax=Streptomyces sp. NPDC007971 TaxID=3364799 RepID=UPI0036DFF7C2